MEKAIPNRVQNARPSKNMNTIDGKRFLNSGGKTALILAAIASLLLNV